MSHIQRYTFASATRPPGSRPTRLGQAGTRPTRHPRPANPAEEHHSRHVQTQTTTSRIQRHTFASAARPRASRPTRLDQADTPPIGHPQPANPVEEHHSRHVQTHTTNSRIQRHTFASTARPRASRPTRPDQADTPPTKHPQPANPAEEQHSRHVQTQTTTRRSRGAGAAHSAVARGGASGDQGALSTYNASSNLLCRS
jgi:hypothetical protein